MYNKKSEKIGCALYSVEPDVFNIFDFPFIQGDPFTALNDPYSAVLTENFAKKLFGNSNAIGKTVLFDKLTFTVNGILKKIPENSIFDFDMLVTERLRTIIYPDWEKRWWEGGILFSFLKVRKLCQ